MDKTEWFDKPRAESLYPKTDGLSRYVWASICAGTGGGLVIGLMVIIIDAYGRAFGKPMTMPQLDFGLELSAIAMVFFASGAFGLMVGAPIAFVFGSVLMKLTQGLSKIWREIVRYGLGFLIAVLTIYLINLITDAKPPIFLEPMQYFMALLGGTTAVWIFLFTIQNSPQEKTS